VAAPTNLHAEDEKPAAIDTTVATERPLPPRYGPQVAPPLTYGYHQEPTVPTPTEKWIDVDLSEQRVVAYEGGQAVRAFIVSTGLPATPTVQGQFRIRMKVRSQTMAGGSAQYGYYNLPNVEWVQYFYADYAFHGTYWHNNFGQPMSHGCVNMSNDDARWLFEWAGPTWQAEGSVWQKPADPSLGTVVVVHE
jgi:lipoprotein-anchoring transpeptidase ErfK/SrfK